MATKIKPGSRGVLVSAVQCIVGLPKKKITGYYGSVTTQAVKAWQKKRGMSPTGKVGSPTWRAIHAELPTIRVGDLGRAVGALEALMGIKINGKYSDANAAAVMVYQTTKGLPADGVVGPDTWGALLAIDENAAGSDDDSATTSPPATVTNKRPTDYKQGDSRWGSKMYSSRGDKSQTMRSSGCGPTAAANIIATWFDKTVTPWTLAQKFVAKGYRTANDGTAWGAFKWLAGQYPVSKFVQTSSHATAIAALNQGALIVASMGPGYWTSAGHFITLWKCDGETMYACDPASKTRKKQALTAFKKQVKQYFIFYP